jgi:hypothetical protein
LDAFSRTVNADAHLAISTGSTHTSDHYGHLLPGCPPTRPGGASDEPEEESRSAKPPLRSRTPEFGHPIRGRHASPDQGEQGGRSAPVFELGQLDHSPQLADALHGVMPTTPIRANASLSGQPASHPPEARTSECQRQNHEKCRLVDLERPVPARRLIRHHAVELCRDRSRALLQLVLNL